MGFPDGSRLDASTVQDSEDGDITDSVFLCDLGGGFLLYLIPTTDLLFLVVGQAAFDLLIGAGPDIVAFEDIADCGAVDPVLLGELLGGFLFKLITTANISFLRVS